MAISRLLCALLFVVSVSVALDVAILYRLFSAPSAPLAATAGKPQVEQHVRELLPTPTLSLANLVTEGNTKARLAIVEFSDYECPYCARHATTVLGELRKQFVGTGKVLYAFVNNPLPMHPAGKLLARGALCAAEQGQFSNMYSGLFRKSPRSESEVRKVANDLNLEPTAFEQCMKDPRIEHEIERQKQLASNMGFTSTPTFGLGIVSTTDGTISIHKAIVGSQPLTVFQAAVRDLEVEAGFNAQK